jgi:hypothetical protein
MAQASPKPTKPREKWLDESQSHPLPLTEADKDAIDWEIIKNDDEADSVDAREFLAKLMKQREARLAKKARNLKSATK